MKYTKYVFVILLSLVTMISGGVNALAMETGFSTEEMSQESIDNLLKNIDLTPLTSEPRKGSIVSFDVSENGMVAIVHQSLFFQTISVYNIEGQFQYGYSLDYTQSLELEFDNDNLIICFVRSDVALSVDSNGEVQSALEIPNTEENREYWKYLSNLREMEVGDTKYELRRSSLVGFSQIVAINASGEEAIIYDASSETLTDDIFLIGGCSIFFAFCAIVVFKKRK